MIKVLRVFASQATLDFSGLNLVKNNIYWYWFSYEKANHW